MSPLLNDGEAFYGYIHSIDDALLLVEAVRRRLVPRIFYRLTDSEQLSIRSGSVFVWHEDEANIKRWTDGKFWSNSRMKGRFFLYKELSSSKKLIYGARQKNGATASNHGVVINGAGLSSFPQVTSHSSSVLKKHSNTLLSNFPTKDFFRKKTISVRTRKNEKFHLVNYYYDADVKHNRLVRPSQCTEFKHLHIEPGFYLTGLDSTPLMITNSSDTTGHGIVYPPPPSSPLPPSSVTSTMIPTNSSLSMLPELLTSNPFLKKKTIIERRRLCSLSSSPSSYLQQPMIVLRRKKDKIKREDVEEEEKRKSEHEYKKEQENLHPRLIHPTLLPSYRQALPNNHSNSTISSHPSKILALYKNALERNFVDTSSSSSSISSFPINSTSSSSSSSSPSTSSSSSTTTTTTTTSSLSLLSSTYPEVVLTSPDIFPPSPSSISVLENEANLNSESMMIDTSSSANATRHSSSFLSSVSNGLNKSIEIDKELHHLSIKSHRPHPPPIIISRSPDKSLSSPPPSSTTSSPSDLSLSSTMTTTTTTTSFKSTCSSFRFPPELPSPYSCSVQLPITPGLSTVSLSSSPSSSTSISRSPSSILSLHDDIPSYPLPPSNGSSLMLSSFPTIPSNSSLPTCPAFSSLSSFSNVCHGHPEDQRHVALLNRFTKI